MDKRQETSPEESQVSPKVLKIVAKELRRQARDGRGTVAERARKALLAEECDTLASRAETSPRG